MKIDQLQMMELLANQSEKPIDPKGAKSVEAAKQFESYLVEMMIREMRKTLPKGGVFDSDVMSTFNGMFDRALADEIASGNGMGFSQALLRSWGEETGAVRRAVETSRAVWQDLHSHDDSVPGLDGQFPVKGHLSSKFGRRRHPITGKHSQHKGIDIAAPKGAEILSVKPGTVTVAGDRGGFGKVVVVDHGDGWTSTYAHCSEINVRVGQQVSAEDIVGLVGSTGQSTGPHLHFEIHYEGRALDPQKVFNWEFQ